MLLSSEVVRNDFGAISGQFRYHKALGGGLIKLLEVVDGFWIPYKGPYNQGPFSGGYMCFQNN